MEEYNGKLSVDRLKFCANFYQSFYNLPVRNDNMGRYWTLRSFRRYDGRLWEFKRAQKKWVKYEEAWRRYPEESDEISGCSIYKMESGDTSSHHRPWKNHPIFHERLFSHSSIMSTRKYNPSIFDGKKILNIILLLNKRAKWDSLYSSAPQNISTPEEFSSDIINLVIDKFLIGKRSLTCEVKLVRTYNCLFLKDFEFLGRVMNPMFQIVYKLRDEESGSDFGHLVIESSLHWKFLTKETNESFIFFGYLINHQTNEISFLQTTGWIFEVLEYENYDRYCDTRGLFLNRLLIEYLRIYHQKPHSTKLKRYIRRELYETSLSVSFEKPQSPLGIELPPSRLLDAAEGRPGAKHPNVGIHISPSSFCRNCGITKVKLMKCSGCNVFYCGRKCQSVHWKKYHKKSCKHFSQPARKMAGLGQGMEKDATLMVKLAEYATKNPGIEEYPDFLFRTHQEKERKPMYDLLLKMKKMEINGNDEGSDNQQILELLSQQMGLMGKKT